MGQQLSTDPNLGRIVISPVYFIQFKASSIAKIFCFKRGIKKGCGYSKFMWHEEFTFYSIPNHY